MRGACNSGIAVCESAEHYGVYAQDVWKNGEPSLVNHYIHNNSLIKILDIWGTLANYSQHVQPNYPFGWIFFIFVHWIPSWAQLIFLSNKRNWMTYDWEIPKSRLSS